MRSLLVAVAVVLAASAPAAVAAPERAGPPPGVFMADPGGAADPLLYISSWNRDGAPALDLVCGGPCFGGRGDKPEAYTSRRLREISPQVWEATLRGGRIMRVDLRSGQTSLALANKQYPLHALTFQDATNHTMNPELGETQAMLFAIDKGESELLIKPEIRTGAPADGDFLYLAAGSTRVQTVHTRNWHYVLARNVSTDVAGLYYAQLHGEVALPSGETATIIVDIVRTPESDVGMWLGRPQHPNERLWQTNDSNTHELKACDAGRLHCGTLFLAMATQPLTCPGAPPAPWIAIWLDDAGGWRALSGEDHGPLRGTDCQVAADLAWVGDTKVVIKGLTATPLESTTAPGN